MNDSRPLRARFSIVSLVYLREMRDQLRDRRTIFTIVILPLVLYPLLGSLMLQVAQFSSQQQASICVVGAHHLPAAPALFTSGGHFQEAYLEPGSALDVVLQPTQTDLPTAELNAKVESWVQSGLFHVAIQVTEASAADQAVALNVVHNVSSDTSSAAYRQVLQVLAKWRDDCILARLDAAGLNETILKPVSVASIDVAPSAAGESNFWSKLLPFVMLVWALTGAFYPAIDLVAGEKERGTLETLLCSPALRSEIVMGKMAAVTSFSVITAILNVVSMLFTSLFVSRQVFAAGGFGGAMGAPDPSQILWLLLALLPLSALFSALALAVASLARSSKEGQYYLMPLMMLALPLVMLPMLPGIELNAGNSLIPVSGMFLLTRALMDGQYWLAITHLPLVAVVTGVCLYLATRWARRQFEDESALFRGGDQWSVGTWVRHLWRDRQGEASVGQAYGCAAIILVGLFFAKLVVSSSPTNFPEIARLIIAPQLGIILAPALLMACVLTRSLRRSLNMNKPPTMAWPVAIILGCCIHPAYAMLASLIQAVYPLSPQTIESLGPFEQLVNEAPFWNVVLVLALIPAICEEIAYRGFIFNGLRQNQAGLRAVLVTAVLFGLSHGVLQQSLAATVMGLMLGWITLRCGSLFPAMIIHVINNALSVSLGRLGEINQEWQRFFFETSGESTGYGIGWTLISAGIAISCLIYYSTLQAPPAYEADEESHLLATSLPNGNEVIGLANGNS